MKLNAILFGAMGGLAVLALASPASATIVDVVYKGIVTSDYDQTGIFGTVGGSNDLVGDSYTAKFVFDTTKGYAYDYPGYYQYAYGGSAYGNASPVISATVTIGSKTVAVPSSYFSEVYSQNPGYYGSGEQYHLAESYSYDGNNYQYGYSQSYVYGNSGTIPYSLTGPFKYTLAGGDYGYQNYENYAYNYTSGQQIYTYVNADVSSLTVTSGVPELSTWAMLMLGFAGLGFAGYRRGKSEGAALAA